VQDCFLFELEKIVRICA